MPALVLLLCLCAGGCALSQRAGPEDLAPAADGGMVPPDAGAAPAADDRDGDGLCDATELDVGSDPDELDTDQDGYPDLVEVMAAFDPRDPESPGIDQVGFLVAAHDRTLDFDARVTVDGMGEGYTGLFTAYPSTNVDDLTAQDFLVGGRALEAEPPDNVRDLNESREHFGSVVGHTRLAFRLRFAFKQAASEVTCADAFSFSYGVKDDVGERQGTRDYMLVVAPEGSAGLDPKRFCVPAGCL